ncbi:MAG: hypothetical protein KDH96_11255, partial [Candidatus Riesia sp.]|nr:hypothetical protein [Candidatus Riesia sp.]
MALLATGLGSKGVEVDVNRTTLYLNTYNNTDAFISSITLANITTSIVSGTIEFYSYTNDDYYYLIRNVAVSPNTSFVYDYDVCLNYYDEVSVTSSIIS